MRSISRQEEIDLVATVTTPENVQFEFRIAGFARRFPAFLVDFLLRVAVMYLVVILLTCAGQLTFSDFGMATAAAIGFIIFFVMSWFYGTLFEFLYRGQTPGKKLMGIRVVMGDGRSVSLVAALVRNLCRTADILPVYAWNVTGDMTDQGIPIPLFMSGILCMLITNRFQRLGDIAANTIVVIIEPEYTSRLGELRDDRMDAIASSLPQELVLQPTTVQALSLYIDRRSRLNTVQREEICAPFVDEIRNKYDLPKEFSNDFVVCALHYREFYMKDDRIQLELYEEPSKLTVPVNNSSDVASVARLIVQERG
jgi:uncharacterized RDD family membrane protein YckC